MYVGTNEGAQEYISEDTNVVDAAGRTVMPGFIDAHIHFVTYGLLGHGIINVDYNHVDSIKDIVELYQKRSREKKAGRVDRPVRI